MCDITTAPTSEIQLSQLDAFLINKWDKFVYLFVIKTHSFY